MKQKWDERYGEPAFAYGKEPNVFFKEWLLKFEPGSILMPADGEGRNGVFAARTGWEVTSFDLSEQGRSKALQLAKEHNVTMSYMVEDFEQLHFEKESFDAIGLIYAHVAAAQKPLFHQRINDWLKPGGIIIFEAFSKDHLAFKQLDAKVGGPDDINMLYSKEELVTALKNYDPLLLTQEDILLNEGNYHLGKGSVIRFVGRKK
jgi:SAM-dependent methyltransferase